MNIQAAASGTDEFNSLILKLNDFDRNRPESLFMYEKTLKDLKDEANRLKQLNLGLGFAALGSIACIQGDEQLMRKLHGYSLQYYPEATTYSNFGSSLFKKGHLEEAIPYFERAIQFDPSYAKAILSLVRVNDLLENEEAYEKYRTMLENINIQLLKKYEKERVESEEFISTGISMLSAESSLLKIWDNPEEDAAWN